jgi:hypothetical protein
MARREEYAVELLCQKCGQSGSAVISEFESPVFDRKPDRLAESVPDGFEWVSGGETWGSSATFLCTKCGSLVAPRNWAT